MPRELIISMTAANRAGILAAVTGAMSELGGDVREASQTVVRGYFTMIFSAEFPEHIDPSVVHDHLQDKCRPFGIELSVQDPAGHLSAMNSYGKTKPLLLRIGGRNRPGALLKLSTVMSMRSIDITGMHAVRTEEGRAFEMVLKLAVPEECSIESLLTEIEVSGAEFQMTADLREYTG